MYLGFSAIFFCYWMSSDVSIAIFIRYPSPLTCVCDKNFEWIIEFWESWIVNMDRALLFEYSDAMDLIFF